jgi:hypothetical protein
MPVTRRALLGLGAGGLAATVAGCSGSDRGPEPEPYCTSQLKLARHSSLRNAKFVYDPDRQPTSFSFDRGFYGQLGTWLEDYLELSGTSRPDQVWTYGSWLDGHPQCDSWHDAGRAFDLSRLVTAGAVQVSCRYDIWSTYTGSRLSLFRTRYWALAASLHLHFEYVLTHLYNADHHNHIHIDNGRSGSGLSSFDTDSVSQVQAVQAILTHLWDKPVPITGQWNRQTRNATGDVLDDTEVGGTIDDGDDHWRTFLRQSAQRSKS